MCIRSEISTYRNLALDLVLHVSASQQQMEMCAQVRDNVSNAFLASVKLPGERCSCMSQAAKFGARTLWLADSRICCIAACASLATCMLDVKAGYCGLCYQSLPSAVVTKVLEECTEFCEQLGTDQLYVMSYLFGLHVHRPQQLLLDCQ